MRAILIATDSFWLFAAIGPVNIALFFLSGWWTRWLNLGVGITITAFFLAVEISNVTSGCYPWSPKHVVFHQGMTLCPGQSAEISVPVWHP